MNIKVGLVSVMEGIEEGNWIKVKVESLIVGRLYRIVIIVN
jgi:hypothetical protein